MPQISPAGGLSLIIHILVNILVFTYKKIVKLLKASENNLVANTFDKLVNKESDTVIRKAFAYSIIAFVFVAMGTNFVFMTLRLFKLSQEKVSQIKNTPIVSSFIDKENSGQGEVNTLVEMSTSTETEVRSTPKPFKFKNMEIKVESIPDEEGLTLVAFMRKVGILDTSFNNRAELALELGVVENTSEYEGSTLQNRDVINKLIEELKKTTNNQN